MSQLRNAIAQTQQERPFEIVAAVILLDHLHFLWRLPHEDQDYSSRVGRMKVLFTRALRGDTLVPDEGIAFSSNHRERDVWQRRLQKSLK
ncbi:MAG: hypothetical protein F6J87_14160 [Spirulina sp. SIO3F2]|nr:hypothetical protein [Spirulina sp. SIO3F2]